MNQTVWACLLSLVPSCFFLLTALDYETTTQHVLPVQIHDTYQPQMSTTLTFIVNVNPVNEYNPVFTPVTYTTALDEDVPALTRFVDQKANSLTILKK